MLSFSTGAKIENGKIAGKIIPYAFTGKDSEKTSGVDVVAYRMDGMDSIPDPRNDVPDYATQSGADGTYEMIGLSSGVYRLFAIGDKDHDGFYSEGYDLIGISPHDVVIAAGDSLVYAHDMAVSERDTSGIQLVSISVPDSRRIELYFDRDGKRFRSIGCLPCCSPIDSDADTIDEIIAELQSSKTSERAGRAQVKEAAYTMQKLRSLGYM